MNGLDMTWKGGEIMAYRIIRFVIALLFAIMGFVAIEETMPLLSPWIDMKFLNMGFFGISLVKILAFVLGGITGAIIGYIVAPYFINQGLKLSKIILQSLSVFSAQDLLFGTLGLVFGLIIANLIGSAFFHVPLVGPYIPIGLSAILGYIGMRLMMRKRTDISQYLQSLRVSSKTDEGVSSDVLVSPGTVSKLLDTSVIIDGRISDIFETGFLEGPLVVPLFVLEELQHISDSSDTLKRNRGRRGLDVLNDMQANHPEDIVVVDEDFEEISEVDSKLMRLALEHQWTIITNDYNLNKVAILQGIKVLNLNDLSNALKPMLIPGESMHVQVVKEGKEDGQGVAYLEDGTMIVIQGGSTFVNESIDVVVTSVLQTSAGRMIFARPGVL